MKRVMIVIVVLAVPLAAWAAAPSAARINAVHPGLFELGVNIGEPMGISAKLWIDRGSALEGIAAWAFSQGAFALSVDYLVSFPDMLKVQGASIPLYFGIGGISRINAATGMTLGLRVPLGILFIFAKAPIEISLDIVPGLNLFPDMVFLPMGGLAIRYCF